MSKFKYLSAFLLLFTAFTFTSCDDNEPIDSNVVLNPTPSCAEPTSFQASDFISGTNVNLSWVAGGEEDSWEIQYGITGFAIGNGTSIFSENTNVNISGLVSTNNYQFYVRSNCSENEVSAWTGPIVVNSGTPVNNGTFTVKIDGVDFTATSVTAKKVLHKDPITNQPIIDPETGQQVVSYSIAGANGTKLVTVQFFELNRTSYDIMDDGGVISYIPNLQNPLEYYVSFTTTFETIGNISITAHNSSTRTMSATFHSTVSMIDTSTGDVIGTKNLTEGVFTNVNYTIN